MALVYDIETDGLLENVTVIHCIVIFNTKSHKFHYFYEGYERKKYPKSGGILDGVEVLSTSRDNLAAHNQIAYDIPVIEKITGVNIRGNGKTIADTYILSSVLFPERPAHTIESWAETLDDSCEKVQNSDWSVLTDRMLERCKNDVIINVNIRRHFFRYVKANGGNKTWNVAFHTEQYVASAHAEQEDYGVRFDILKAVELIKDFDSKLEVLTKDIIEGVKPVQVIPWKKYRDLETGKMISEAPTVEEPFKTDGDLKAYAKKYFDGYVTKDINKPVIDTVVGPYSKVSWRQINLNSPTEVKKWLKSEGWKPTEWTPKGSPKLTVELKGLDDSLLGKKFKDMNILKHRRRFLLSEKSDGTKTGAVSQVRRRDCRVPASARTCATPTARYRHNGAVCNIPRITSPYGKEIRSLFTVEKGHWMLGIDLSAIEARMMAHHAYNYPGGKKLANLVLTGDFHQYNADALGCDRDTAKTFLYAILYGAGAAKLSRILGCTVGKGKKLIEKFWNSNPALKALIKDLEKSYRYNGGYIHGLDGRRFYVREERNLLNSLLQGDSAIVFKNWGIKVHKTNISNCRQIIAYHDEYQFEITKDDKAYAEKVGDKICSIAKDVGIAFDLNVPIAADYSVGRTWSETH